MPGVGVTAAVARCASATCRRDSAERCPWSSSASLSTPFHSPDARRRPLLGPAHIRAVTDQALETGFAARLCSVVSCSTLI